MTDVLKRFRANLQRARDSRALFSALTAAMAGSRVDLSDLLRFAIVTGVSAFDAFVHELVRLAMVEVFLGARAATPAYGRFAIPLGTVTNMLTSAMPSSLLDGEVRIQHGHKSFQLPDKVADAVRLVSDKDLWREVAGAMGVDAQSAKNRLVLIADRRNKIVHEADMDPSFPGSRWPIDESLVDEALQTLSDIAEAIFTVLSTP